MARSCASFARPVLEHPPIAPTPVESLRRRVRRRRRRLGAATGAVVLALAAATLLLVAPFGADRSIDTRPSGTTPTVPAPAASIGAVSTNAPPIGAMHLWSPRDGYAVNGLGIYVTNDAGAHWRNVAPPDTYDPIGHMTAIDVLDSQHLWTSWALNSHPVSFYRSTDGGRSWVSDAECDTGACPSFMGLTFVDALHGWALSGGDRSPPAGTLYVTSDGGRHWSSLGSVPFNGVVKFADAQHGWGRTGPNGLGANGGYVNPGGALVPDQRRWPELDAGRPAPPRREARREGHVLDAAVLRPGRGRRRLGAGQGAHPDRRDPVDR